jgi:hypothetical protein
MEESGQTHTMATLSLGKNPPYPLERKIGGPQHWSGCFETEINLLILSEFKPWAFKLAL